MELKNIEETKKQIEEIFSSNEKIKQEIIENFKKQIHEIEKEKYTLIQENKNLSEEKTNLSKENLLIQKKLSEIKLEIVDYQKKLNNLKTNLNDDYISIKNHNNETFNLKMINVNLKRQLNKEQENLNNNYISKQDHDQKTNELKIKIVELTKQFQIKQKEFEKQNENLIKEIEQKQVEENEIFNKTIQQLNTEKQELISKLQKETDNLNELKKQQKEKEKEIKKLKEQHIFIIKENKEKEIKIKETENFYNKKNNENERLQKEIERLQKENERLSNLSNISNLFNSTEINLIQKIENKIKSNMEKINDKNLFKLLKEEIFKDNQNNETNRVNERQGKIFINFIYQIETNYKKIKNLFDDVKKGNNNNITKIFDLLKTSLTNFEQVKKIELINTDERTMTFGSFNKLKFIETDIDELEILLTQYNNSINNIEEKKEIKEKEIKEKDETVTEYEKDKNLVEIELLKREIAKLNEEKNDLEKFSEKYKNDNEEKEKEIQELENSLETNTKELREIQSKNTKELREIQSKNSLLQTKNNELLTLQIQKNTEIERLNTEKERLNTKLQEIDNYLRLTYEAKKNQEIEEIKRNYDTEYESNQISIRILNQNVEQLKETIKSNQIRFEEFEKEKNSEKDELIVENHLGKNKIIKLEEKLEKLNEQIKELKEKNKNQEYNQISDQGNYNEQLAEEYRTSLNEQKQYYENEIRKLIEEQNQRHDDLENAQIILNKIKDDTKTEEKKQSYNFNIQNSTIDNFMLSSQNPVHQFKSILSEIFVQRFLESLNIEDNQISNVLNNMTNIISITDENLSKMEENVLEILNTSRIVLNINNKTYTYDGKIEILKFYVNKMLNQENNMTEQLYTKIINLKNQENRNNNNYDDDDDSIDILALDHQHFTKDTLSTLIKMYINYKTQNPKTGGNIFTTINKETIKKNIPKILNMLFYGLIIIIVLLLILYFYNKYKVINYKFNKIKNYENNNITNLENENQIT